MSDSTHTDTTPTVILVHGAFVDASSWNGVIAELKAAGLDVVAPPNLLRGVGVDAAYLTGFVVALGRLSWYSRRKVSTSLACLSILADRRLSPAATALTTPGSSESSRRSALCTTTICAVSGLPDGAPGSMFRSQSPLQVHFLCH